MVELTTCSLEELALKNAKARDAIKLSYAFNEARFNLNLFLKRTNKKCLLKLFSAWSSKQIKRQKKKGFVYAQIAYILVVLSAKCIANS